MGILILIGLIVLFVAVILVRTLNFKPKDVEQDAVVNPKKYYFSGTPDSKKAPLKIDQERAFKHLQAMIRLETIKGNDKALEDFRDLLPTLYTGVYEALTVEVVGKSGLLYRWKGKSSEHPTIYMSHYDVVPAEAENWTKPPFSGERLNGEIWGRGTLDTKGTLCAILETAETLLAEGFVPEKDIYFAFGGDEETDGTDARAIVELLEKRGVRAGLVLDEGGAVVENVFPGLKGKAAVIGTGEKGMCNVTLTAKTPGGHASTPPREVAITKLAKAITKINKNPFKPVIAEPVAQMFDTLGRHSTFLYRMIFANLWLFRGLLIFAFRKMGGEMDAMMRTSIAFTKMEGSPAHNVLPPTAKVSANLRLMHTETLESVERHFNSVINDDSIEVKAVGESASSYADTASEGYARVTNAITATWDDTIVSPYLMMACTDSRFYTKISDCVLRFSAMYMSREDRNTIHGHDERIREEQFIEALEFYQQMMLAS